MVTGHLNTIGLCGSDMKSSTGIVPENETHKGSSDSFKSLLNVLYLYQLILDQGPKHFLCLIVQLNIKFVALCNDYPFLVYLSDQNNMALHSFVCRLPIAQQTISKNKKEHDHHTFYQHIRNNLQ